MLVCIVLNGQDVQVYNVCNAGVDINSMFNNTPTFSLNIKTEGD